MASWLANKRFNEEFTIDLLKSMPEEKKEILRKALDRNFYFTSSWTLEHGTMKVYKEGWYIELRGTQCGFKVFIKDNDGEFETIRKPIDKKLSKLYETSIHMWEGDYEDLR